MKRFTDNIRISNSNIRTTDEGFLIIRANFARTGLYEYPEYGTIYRDEKTVFDKNSMDTLVGKSLTIEHPDGFVNPKNWKDLEVGSVLTVDKSEKFLVGDLIFKDENTIGFINKSIQRKSAIELSCGYTANVTDSKGEYDGKQYDGTQENIRYNHIALVTKGRAGEEVKLLIDSLTISKGEKMKVKLMDSFVEIDEKDLRIVDEANTKLGALNDEKEDLAAKNKVLEAQVADNKEKIEDLESKIVNDGDVEEMANEIAEVSSMMDSLKLEKAEKLIDNKVKIIDHFLPVLKIADSKDDKKTLDVAWESAKSLAKEAIDKNKGKVVHTNDSAYLETAEFVED